MFHKEEVQKILAEARCMDPQLEMFGVADHQYRLGPPVDLAFVRAMEKKYHFRFPDDYVQFITEVGDGGAGPGYGLYPFGYYCTEAKSKEEAKAREMYLRGMGRELRLLPIEPEWLEDFCISKEEYKKNPEKFFRGSGGSFDWDNNIPYGFFHLGTYGCWRDFGLITAGERCGQVFIHDTEGAFELETNSFQVFYQNWLDFILDTERFQNELEEWRRIRNR
ncbi:MAG TPA: hypothetical protein DEB74_15480 [Lachnospiraceae bacterium]|jgi:hypothetical protein|nr:hypothetical protein [Lachnospiraceae bacterium]